MTPHDPLVEVLLDLASDLPGELGALLDHPRFATGAAALRRLADPASAASAADACPPEEARWLAATLLARRARLLGSATRHGGAGASSP